MLNKYSKKLPIFVIINFIIGVNGRCGYPEMPYLAKSIESKDFFEEGQKLSIGCIGSVIVGQNMRDHVIECRNNTWNTTSLRCSHVHNITSIDITSDDNSVHSVLNTNLMEKFLYLSDNDPTTCVLLKDIEKWVLHLSENKFVSNIAIIAAFVGTPEGSGHKIEISVSLPNKQMCRLEEKNEGHNSALIFLIYKCPDSQPTENITIDLKTNQNSINVCGLEIFTLMTDDCGKPEIPLYSYANQMKIQNGTKIAEYVCAKGYHMIGSPLRTCSSNGLWIPHEPPVCVPEVKCSPYNEIHQNFTLEYKDFDLFGNAIPDVSIIGYHCTNRSELISPRTDVYCLSDGNWSQLDYIPECHPRSHVIVVFGHHFLNDKHLIYYGASGLVILFVGSFVILFQMRRLAKKISRQMRERSYYEQEKALPHYSNEANYQDMTNLFSGQTGDNATTPATLPTVQQTDQKY